MPPSIHLFFTWSIAKRLPKSSIIVMSLVYHLLSILPGLPFVVLSTIYIQRFQGLYSFYFTQASLTLSSWISTRLLFQWTNSVSRAYPEVTFFLASYCANAYLPRCVQSWFFIPQQTIFLHLSYFPQIRLTLEFCSHMWGGASFAAIFASSSDSTTSCLVDWWLFPNLKSVAVFPSPGSCFTNSFLS